MLDVTFYEDGRKRLSSFSARGHADTAAHGEDLVCAAVSAILQAARLGLEAHLRVALSVHQESGDMQIAWSEADRDNAELVAIVRTAELATLQIARQYPSAVHVRRMVRND